MLLPYQEHFKENNFRKLRDKFDSLVETMTKKCAGTENRSQLSGDRSEIVKLVEEICIEIEY
jgi:hypothetical protein